jgi:hypothetical protein
MLELPAMAGAGMMQLVDYLIARPLEIQPSQSSKAVNPKDKRKMVIYRSAHHVVKSTVIDCGGGIEHRGARHAPRTSGHLAFIFFSPASYSLNTALIFADMLRA